MKLLKKTLPLFLVISAVCSIFAQENTSAKEKYSLEKIKVCIDKAVYTCTEKGMENISGEASFIKPETVLSFCSLKSGKSYTAKELEIERIKTELRLENSNLFYTVSSGIIHSRKNNEDVTLIIEVKEGFLHRFGGGNLYGFYGRDCLFGKRQSAVFYAGYNHNGLQYTNQNVFDKGMIFSSHVFFDGPEGFVQDYIKESSLKLKEEGGFFINPDLRLCLDVREKIVFTEDDFEMILSPYVNYSTFLSRNALLETEARGYFDPFDKAIGTEAFAALDYDFTLFFTMAAMVCAGAYKGGNDKGFDLYNRKDNISESAALCNSFVRSGYKAEELFASRYIYASMEARFPFIKIHPIPLINLTVSPFVYTDIAFVDSFDGKGFRDGFGVGIRFFFDSPVFTWFTFSYGANDRGEGRFVFSASKGY